MFDDSTREGHGSVFLEFQRVIEGPVENVAERFRARPDFKKRAHRS
jgi:hypothetical protein